jgi:hypothetical protein
MITGNICKPAQFLNGKHRYIIPLYIKRNLSLQLNDRLVLPFLKFYKFQMVTENQTICKNRTSLGFRFSLNNLVPKKNTKNLAQYIILKFKYYISQNIIFF